MRGVFNGKYMTILSKALVSPVGEGFNIKLSFLGPREASRKASFSIHLQKKRTPQECAERLRELADEIELHYTTND